MSRALEFGFRLSPYARFVDVADLLDTVVFGEELGFDVVALPEHLLPPAAPDEPKWTKVWYDQATLSAFLAARTRRIVFMPGVHVAPYHPPVQAAKALATLDVLSGGRVRLAVGVGWLKGEFERLAIPYEERGAITDEYIQAMRELWTSENPSFLGRYVAFDDVSFLPRPVRREGIPIYIGGTGPRPFRRVAEFGNGWYPMTVSPAELRAGIEEIGRLMIARGRDPESLWVGCSFEAGDDPELEQLRRNVRLPAGSGALVSDGVMTSEPSRRTPGECIRGIEEFRDGGAKLIIVGFGWRNGADLREELRWFAHEVIPAFR